MIRPIGTITITLAAAAACAAAATGTAGAAAATASGNKGSYGPDVSATGRYVVFASDATNLVAGDTNSKRDIFIRDTVAKRTRLVSIGRAGAKSNGPSYSPTVSDDGRYVAFSSDATNLVAGDTNGKRDVFRADLHTGMTVRVSVSGSGSQGNDASDRGKISGNGSAIAFESGASNLVARDTNHATDIFLRDLPGTIRRVSLMPTGDQLSNAASQATISNNGALVGFMGLSGSSDAIFQWSRRLQRTTILSEEASDHQVGSPVTSNGGVSSAGEETNFDCWNSGISVTASPKSESFYIDDDCGSVGYATTIGGISQIQLWNWKTGATATVSTS